MTHKTHKARDLLIVALIYCLAYGAGYAVCRLVPEQMPEQMLEQMLGLLMFDLVATVVVYLFSTALRNSSVYDPYWSLTPLVMAAWLFRAAGARSLWQWLFLAVFGLWSLRLTLNWVSVFTDFSYEDWRYRQYRAENPPALWHLINLTGIHLVPTLVVFAGMLPLFPIARHPLGPLSLPGMGIMAGGIALEFFADRQMHRHLAAATGRVTCRAGLWRYSRHPNYLGEIALWVGVYAVMLPYAPRQWYYGGGAVAVAVLFNAVSVPLMERRQRARRADYADYCRVTSRLLLRAPRPAAEPLPVGSEEG